MYCLIKFQTPRTCRGRDVDKKVAGPRDYQCQVFPSPAFAYVSKFAKNDNKAVPPSTRYGIYLEVDHSVREMRAAANEPFGRCEE